MKHLRFKLTNMKGDFKDGVFFFDTDEPSVDMEKSDDSDWITKLTPLLVSVLFGGEY